jgi:hypothetical protein
MIYFAYGADLCRAHMALWCPHSGPLVAAAWPDHPALYERIGIRVFTPQGPVDAVTYRMRQAQPFAPPPEYLALIEEGYRDWQLDADAIPLKAPPERPAGATAPQERP